MSDTSHRTWPLLQLLAVATAFALAAVPAASARPLQAQDGTFGAVEWDSLVALQNSDPRTEPAFHFGPILGAMFLKVGDATFFAPTYGGSVRRDDSTFFLGDGRIGSDDRVRFAGLRFALPRSLFGQVTAVDARQVLTEFDAYTHRAIGATAGVGYERLGRRFHGSLFGGVGGFDLVTPKQEDSETAFGFSVSGHAGFTF